jgi:hypothetical protein
LKYQVRIDVVSMFDGVIDEPEQGEDEELERLIQAVNRRDPEELARDVSQTISLVICRQCRNQLVKEYETKTCRTMH